MTDEISVVMNSSMRIAVGREREMCECIKGVKSLTIVVGWQFIIRIAAINPPTAEAAAEENITSLALSLSHSLDITHRMKRKRYFQ